MSDDHKQKGLETRFRIIKLTNPEKQIDALVLEFDDPIAQAAIIKYCEIAVDQGYDKLVADLKEKLKAYGYQECQCCLCRKGNQGCCPECLSS